MKRLAPRAPLEEIALTLGRTLAAVRTKAAQKRIAVQGRALSQGPPRLRLPWEDERDRT